MKTSTTLLLTDILPEKRGWFNKIVKMKGFDSKSPQEIFASLKSAGVEGIELFLPSYAHITAEDMQRLKQLLEKNKLPVLSVHQSLRFFSITKVDEVKELFETAKQLGAKVIVLHMSSVGKQIFDKKYIEMIHAFEEKYGIKAGFENQEKFIGSMLRPYAWHHEKFPNLMGENNLSITLDTTHLALSGGDIIAFFKKNKDRIVNIHLSDYKHHYLNSSLRPLRFKHLPLGKGELPILQFLKMLKQEHYKGLVTMEINTDLDGLCEGARMISESKK